MLNKSNSVSSKKKILIVTQHPPLPNHGGGQLILQRCIELSKQAELHLISKTSDKDAPRIDRLVPSIFSSIVTIKKVDPRRKPLSFLWHQCIMAQWSVVKTLRQHKFSAIQLEYTWSTLYFFLLKPFLRTPIYTTEHDVTYTATISRLKFQGKNFVSTKIKSVLIALAESFFLLTVSTKILTWGSDDVKSLKKIGIPAKKISIIPPTISTSSIWEIPNELGEFTFIGSSHGPNRDSLNYIISNLWPEIKKIFANPHLNIIGNMEKVSNLDPSIQYLGFVENIDDYLKNTTALLAPIAWGGGIKVKIAEAFTKGIPVLTNTEGLRNFDALSIPGINIEKNENIQKILQLYSKKSFLNQLSNQEKKYSERFAPDNTMPLYKKLYNL